MLLVKFTDDMETDGVINTKDKLLLQSDLDHWRPHQKKKKSALIEQIKASALGY